MLNILNNLHDPIVAAPTKIIIIAESPSEWLNRKKIFASFCLFIINCGDNKLLVLILSQKKKKKLFT